MEQTEIATIRMMIVQYGMTCLKLEMLEKFKEEDRVMYEKLAIETERILDKYSSVLKGDETTENKV